MTDGETYPERCLSSYDYLYQKDILKGQVAFITGGGSGIGFRIAEIFMRHGCDVAIASRKEQKLLVAKEKLEAAVPSRKCYTYAMNVRDPADVMRVVEKILADAGRIDILINNAAGNFLCPLENLSPNGFKAVMETDTYGHFNASKAVFEKYLKAHGGNIVHISAILGQRGSAMQAHAGAAKAAIDALSRHMAVEWGKYNIRSNCVAPGAVSETEGFRRLGGKDISAETFADFIPLRKISSPADVAHAVLFLVAPTAAMVTGTILVVDGGSWMTMPSRL